MKLKLIFAIAAFVTGRLITKQRHVAGEELLACIAKDLSCEDFKGCGKHMTTLADRFGHNSDVQNCIMGALRDARDVFGAADARAINSAIRSVTTDPQLARRLRPNGNILGTFIQDDIKARNEMISLLSKFTKSQTFPGSARAAVNTNIPVTRHRMTPDEFLSRNIPETHGTIALRR